MQEKSTIHVFGCSFSLGTGIFYRDFEKPIYLWGKKYVDWWWGNQLARYLDMEVANHGLGGGSNTTTHNRITKNLKNIKSGDIVFIGETEPNRIRTINNSLHNKNGVVVEFDTNLGWMNEWLDMEEKNLTAEEKTKRWEELGCPFKYFDQTEVDVLMAYGAYYTSNNEKAFNYEYHDIFLSIREYLSTKNVSTFIFNKKIWNIGESINDWWPKMDLSEYPIHNFHMHDGHWSPDGHTTISQFFMWCVDNNKHDITVSDWFKNSLNIYDKYNIHTLDRVERPVPDEEMVLKYIESKNSSSGSF